MPSASSPPGSLSFGQQKPREFAMAVMNEPEALLLDEPSIGLEPRSIDVAFGMPSDLQHRDGKTNVMVEQKAARGLELEDLGHVIVSDAIAMAAPGRELLGERDIRRLLLGG